MPEKLNALLCLGAPEIKMKENVYAKPGQNVTIDAEIISYPRAYWTRCIFTPCTEEGYCSDTFFKDGRIKLSPVNGRRIILSLSVGRFLLFRALEEGTIRKKARNSDTQILAEAELPIEPSFFFRKLKKKSVKTVQLAPCDDEQYYFCFTFFQYWLHHSEINQSTRMLLAPARNGTVRCVADNGKSKDQTEVTTLVIVSDLHPSSEEKSSFFSSVGRFFRNLF